jgi:GTP-binding protein
VGKSTLVNRFVGRRAAVVQEKPGVTRDRLELDCEWNGRPFVVVDTGGWLGRGDTLDAKVTLQAERAVAAADLVLLVVDAAVGVTSEDEDVARLLTRSGRRVMLVANKVDNDRREAEAWELVSLGLGDPWMVSALHGRGTGDLLDEVVRLLPDPATSEADGDDGGSESGDLDPEAVAIRVAIVGRPNVGKSTLFNRMIGEERSVVHDLPGTTRDAIDTQIETDQGPIRFIDTAGMRRRSRTEEGTEFYAMVRALQALDHADVVLLVIDATDGVTHQDQRLAERIGASGSPVLVILNKWELLDAETRRDVVDAVDDRLAFLGESPTVKVSAQSGMGVHKILPALALAVEAYHHRIPTGELNRAMRSIQADHAAPGARIRYAVQGAIDPPTFTLFATRRLPAPYLRYVEHKLREHFGIGPTPVKFRVRIGS